MFVGTWESNKPYNREDIVYESALQCYFICCITHLSSGESHPKDDQYYWLSIDSVFLANIGSNKGYTHYSGVLFQEDSFIKNMLDENSALPLRDISESLRASALRPEPALPTFQVPTEEQRSQRSLKRKIRVAEQNIERHKRQRTASSDTGSLRDNLLLMKVDISTKAFIVGKYDTVRKASGTEYTKGMMWLNTVSSIPFGKYKEMKVTHKDNTSKIKDFFQDVRAKLDKSIFGLEDVKQEILEFVARKISNPHSKGHVLALCGAAGTGKTKIIQTLAEALDLPFFQINCGGMNDSALLLGHSETYAGAKPGKVVEFLQCSNYMNPIIYLDEIDKFSESKATELNGVLTHLLDEEQNNKFQDNFLSNVPLNLSRAFFVLAFNDISKVDSIVLDRLKVIHIEKPTLQGKVDICTEKVVPDVMKSIGFRDTVIMNRELIEYIITRKCEQESGVRQLKKTIEKILSRLNYDILIGSRDNLSLEKSSDSTAYVVTTSYVDEVLGSDSTLSDRSYLGMYT